MRLSHIARGALSAENARRLIMLRGYTPNGHRVWERIEATNLDQQYPDYPAAMALNPRRTRQAHYGKAERMGITRPGSVPWSDGELLKLRGTYLLCTRQELLEAFPDRTWAAITARALKAGLSRPLQPLKPSGDALLDQIRERARAWGVSICDLDRDVSGAGYFAKRKWRHGAFNPMLHYRAVKVLGGHLRFRAH
jgi:hypothetical protein